MKKNSIIGVNGGAHQAASSTSWRMGGKNGIDNHRDRHRRINSE